MLRGALVGVVALSGLGIAGIAAVFAAYQAYRSQLPDAATLAAMEPASDTRVFARDGTLLGVLGEDGYHHDHVAVKDISAWVKLATIDVEDRHFYQEGSWDLGRIIKAGWDNLHSGASTQGASTITEQLAKISFLTPERSFDRKIKQVILGIEIENNFSKDQILEMYLNRVDYGNHSLGIESAAQTYFHKPAKALDLAEAAMLSGLPQAPGALNPLNHDAGVTVNPLAKDRQRTVLQAMVRNSDITQAQADAAYAKPLTFHPFWDSAPQVAPDFVGYVESYLTTKFGSQFRKPGGWDVPTTLDPARQAMAEKSVHDGVTAIYKNFNAHDGALVAMDPRNGEVIAMVGAWDNSNPGVGQLNMATQQLQPGSTIKLFTYTTAIASHLFTMRTPVVDAPVALDIGYGRTYAPLDYDRRWHGTCVVATCLGNSLNVPAVKVEAKVGVPLITDLEIAAGLRSLADPDNRPGPRSYAATLGALHHGITPLELVDGASTIASLGIHHDPAPVLKIVDRSTGRVIYAHDAAAEGHRVVPANVAFIMNEITSNDNNRAMEFGYHGALTLSDRRVSAKTGTTEFFISNWTVGWTPELASVVWVGNPSPSCLRPDDKARLESLMRSHLLYSGQASDDPFSPADLAAYGLQPINDHCGHLEGSTGITGAAPIWNSFMKAALAGTPKDWYQRPPDVVAYGSGDDATFFLPGTESSFGVYACDTTQPAACTPPPGSPAPSPKPENHGQEQRQGQGQEHHG